MFVYKKYTPMLWYPLARSILLIIPVCKKSIDVVYGKYISFWSHTI